MKSIVRYGRGSARSLPTHRDGGLEIVLLEKGALNWHVEGRVERVTAGSVYFSLPWQEHGSVDEFEAGHLWQWVQLRLAGPSRRPRRQFRLVREIGLGAERERRLSALLVRSGRHCFPATARMAWLLPALVAELTAGAVGGPPDEVYVNTLTRLVVLELERCIDRAAQSAGATAGAEERVQKFIASLGERVDTAWTLQAMAAACGLGRSRFATLCRKITGDSPLTLVNRLRTEQAKRLLRESAATVTEVAFATGFSSSQYFARVFRAFTAMEPRAYRGRHAAAAGVISPGATSSAGRRGGARGDAAPTRRRAGRG